MQTLTRGILIAIEGIDGSGKSTLARSVYERLRMQTPTQLTKEPGATQLGAYLRSFLQNQSQPLCPKAEYLLFATDRAQHFHEIVLPHLATCHIVLSDRMADSSLVYQGYARGLDQTLIQTVNEWTMEQRTPDLTLYVRITADQAYERLLARGSLSAFEKKRSFTHKLVDGFDALYANRADVTLLDGMCTPDQVAAVAEQTIQTWIENNQLLNR